MARHAFVYLKYIAQPCIVLVKVCYCSSLQVTISSSGMAFAVAALCTCIADVSSRRPTGQQPALRQSLDCNLYALHGLTLPYLDTCSYMPSITFWLQSTVVATVTI
eukprot:TRINITY_DN6948_c0_g3_i1.p1 TRINITY_DN6948_c0_g3~~TRINITY_DN6948_c0_g3_i1.p1  ORF type:complete len:106 (-),score=7.15 TRINITY_DN6948_c0_g3_i1:970-1287(-)